MMQMTHPARYNIIYLPSDALSDFVAVHVQKMMEPVEVERLLASQTATNVRLHVSSSRASHCTPVEDGSLT